MLSPIMPTISLTIEDIPALNIFATGENDSTFILNDYRPKFSTKGASLLEDELVEVGFTGSSDTDTCQVKKTRKATACETELELSVESNISDSPQSHKRKQSLLEGLEPRGCKFERILLEDEDSIEQNFLGKRAEPSTDDDLQGIDQLKKFQSVQPKTTTSNLKCVENHSAHEVKRTCGLGHRLGPLSTGVADCYLCRSVLANIQRFAEEKGGRLLSTGLGPEVSLQCEHLHEWRICYKKATKTWCKDCKTRRKQLLKEMLQAEDERITTERKVKQEQLFEEVKKRVKINEESKKQEMKAELDNLKIVFEEIGRLASKYAREYCQKDQSAEYEQTLLLYQTLILPDKCLSTYFNSLSKVDLRKEFRRYTILLHPDKNIHPKAKQAFQKAYSLLSKLMDTSN